MLDQNDLKQIGTLLQGTEGKLKEFVKENNKELTQTIVLQVGDFITDRVLPQIDELSDKISGIEKTITTLPNRDDLARAVADVKGELVVLVRKEDEKVDLHVKFTHENKALTDQQWKALQELKVFPAIDI